MGSSVDGSDVHERHSGVPVSTPSDDPVLDGVRQLVNEEMHLLAQELEDSLNAGESHRLAQISSVLDEAELLLLKHRMARPSG